MDKRKTIVINSCKCNLMSFSCARIARLMIKTVPSCPSLRRTVFAGVVVAMLATASAWTARGTEYAPAGQYVSLIEASIVPKVGPTWQRPSPATWSSRFNVRWEARFTDQGKYMV